MRVVLKVIKYEWKRQFIFLFRSVCLQGTYSGIYLKNGDRKVDCAMKGVAGVD